MVYVVVFKNGNDETDANVFRTLTAAESFAADVNGIVIPALEYDSYVKSC